MQSFPIFTATGLAIATFMSLFAASAVANPIASAASGFPSPSASQIPTPSTAESVANIVIFGNGTSVPKAEAAPQLIDGSLLVARHNVRPVDGIPVPLSKRSFTVSCTGCDINNGVLTCAGCQNAAGGWQYSALSLDYCMENVNVQCQNVGGGLVWTSINPDINIHNYNGNLGCDVPA
ncbi:hypothetical protein V8F20_005378 [Naviculisporaceae sp. PSN 640]